VLRTGISGEIASAVVTFAFTNVSLLVFHLLPIPGLDGGRLLALLLPPHAREVFRNADRYLALIVLVVLFLFTFLLDIARILAGAICDGLTGVDCSGLFSF
jgi:Zn-dependent protease